MFVIRLGILLIHVIRATTFTGNIVVNSDKGNGVKYHVEGQFSNITSWDSAVTRSFSEHF